MTTSKYREIPTPRPLPNYNRVTHGSLEDFDEKHGIVRICGFDAGMYGNGITYFFLKEDHTKVYVCYDYQSSGWSTNYTCDYAKAIEASWGKQPHTDGIRKSHHDLPENASDHFEKLAESLNRNINDEILYIAHRLRESTEGEKPEAIQRHFAHIAARRESLSTMFQKQANYRELAKQYKTPRGRLGEPESAF